MSSVSIEHDHRSKGKLMDSSVECLKVERLQNGCSWLVAVRQDFLESNFGKNLA